MRNLKLWARAALPVLLGVALPTAIALAAGGRDADEAERVLASVSATPSSSSLAREPLSSAADALRRSRDTRASGDAKRAAMLEALALEWAHGAKDLVRAAESEAQAAELQKRIADTDAKLVRARTLLEQTMARRGRAQVSLDAVSGRPASSAGAPSGPTGRAVGPASSAKPAASGTTAPVRNGGKP